VRNANLKATSPVYNFGLNPFSGPAMEGGVAAVFARATEKGSHTNRACARCHMYRRTHCLFSCSHSFARVHKCFFLFCRFAGVHKWFLCLCYFSLCLPVFTSGFCRCPGACPIFPFRCILRSPQLWLGSKCGSQPQPRQWGFRGRDHFLKALCFPVCHGPSYSFLVSQTMLLLLLCWGLVT
jgi:hypothetical protein